MMEELDALQAQLAHAQECLPVPPRASCWCKMSVAVWSAVGTILVSVGLMELPKTMEPSSPVISVATVPAITVQCIALILSTVTNQIALLGQLTTHIMDAVVLVILVQA